MFDVTDTEELNNAHQRATQLADRYNTFNLNTYGLTVLTNYL